MAKYGKRLCVIIAVGLEPNVLEAILKSRFLMIIILFLKVEAKPSHPNNVITIIKETNVLTL